MVAGAFSGWFTVYMGGDLWTGVFVAAMTGAMFGLLHGFLTVPLGLSQHVTGIGITLLASSLTYFTYRILLPEVTSPPKIEPFQPFRGTGAVGHSGAGTRAVQPDAAHLSRLCHRGGCCIHALPHPGGRCGARRGRKPCGGRGAGHLGDGGQDRRGDGRLGADGDRRRVPDHVGVQFVLLRDDQRARLDCHRAGGVRLLAAREGADRRNSFLLPSTPIRSGFSRSRAASFPTRSS